MEITWLGQSCFRIKGKDATVITDPYDRSLGYTLGKPTAEIVTISHDHPDHNYVEGVGGEPMVITGPGEYEVANVLITGIRTYHDANGGKERGKNTVYLFEEEDITVCHLGDLGHVPTSQQVEAMTNVDILLIPVGGTYTIDAAQATETISLIEPKIVIPMHFQTEALKFKLDPVEKFLKEMGLKEVTPQAKLNVTRNSLPDQTQVIVLDYKK